MIYTVFTLSNPDDINDIRYVGFTTQTIPKRLSDIMSISRGHEYANGYNSLLSQWLRTLKNVPIATVITDTYDRELAIKTRVVTFEHLLPSGRLLNSVHGKFKGKHLRRTVNGQPPGRVVDPATRSAKHMLNLKQLERGEAPRISWSKLV